MPHAIQYPSGDISTASGKITSGLGVTVQGAYPLELGGGVSGKYADAGMLGYALRTAGALDIFGAGAALSSLAMVLWGNVKVQGDLEVTGSIVGIPSSSTPQTAAIQLSGGFVNALAGTTVSLAGEPGNPGGGGVFAFAAGGFMEATNDASGPPAAWTRGQIVHRGVSMGGSVACDVTLAVAYRAKGAATWTDLTPTYVVKDRSQDVGYATVASPWFTFPTVASPSNPAMEIGLRVVDIKSGGATQSFAYRVGPCSMRLEEP